MNAQITGSTVGLVPPANATASRTASSPASSESPEQPGGYPRVQAANQG